MSYTSRLTPTLAGLCTHIVKDMYGDLAQRVFSVLVRFGRQTKAEITRHSNLTKHQIAQGLVILVQMNLVFHSSSIENVASYEISWQQSYALVRPGKIVHFVEQRFDKKSANVISNLLTLGFTSLADLRKAYDASSQEEEGTVDATNDQTSLVNDTELDGIIQTLMEHGWVMQAAQAQFLSAEDMHRVARQEALNDQWGGVEPTGTKDRGLLTNLIMAKKRRMRDAWLEVPNFLWRTKKANNSDHGSRKRARLDGEGQNGSVDDSNDDLVIRVNPEKAAVAMRNHHLVSLVEKRINDTTARLYEILLRSLEKNIPRCFEEYPDPLPANTEDQPQWEPNLDHIVNTKDIAQRAKILGLDICNGLDPHAVARITKTTASKEGVLAQPVDPASLSFHERQEMVEAHLSLLVDDPLRFVTWHARGQYRVDFDLIAKSLIHLEIETTVLAKEGNKARTVLRALQKKGKLNERELCNTIMCTPDDIRSVVNYLTVQGFVQTQEVPKVERREAKLSSYLIWYDMQRARDKILDDTYKAQTRILQRVAYEQEQIQELLEKANRTDVAGNETRYLKQTELDVLKKWRDTQDKLYLQLARQDDLVAVLRDYCGPLLTV
jgi:DNA-directed RNA polymerase III subunit RPC3